MIYVMSDIHGNERRFASVMKQINLQPSDTLYILGDVIDRFPGGIRILRSIMKMPNVKMLLGNHEYMMLNTIDPLTTRNEAALWYQNGGRVTHDYWKRIRKTVREEVFAYLRDLPINIDITVNGEPYKLVHGAPQELYYEHKWEFTRRTEFAVWMRWETNDKTPDEYTMVFGHTPTIFFQSDDPLQIWYGENRIGIDCGSGFPDRPHRDFPVQGRLACLRLDDMTEFYSEEVTRERI